MTKRELEKQGKILATMGQTCLVCQKQAIFVDMYSEASFCSHKCETYFNDLCTKACKEDYTDVPQ